MISRIIEVCERNRFLVFTGAVLLTLTGIWAMGHIPLDALPDISDVQDYSYQLVRRAAQRD